MNQKHITILERESILKFLTLDYSKAEIAKVLKRSRSTITREIKRNTINGDYSPFNAQALYQKRKSNCGAYLYNTKTGATYFCNTEKCQEIMPALEEGVEEVSEGTEKSKKSKIPKMKKKKKKSKIPKFKKKKSE